MPRRERVGARSWHALRLQAWTPHLACAAQRQLVSPVQRRPQGLAPARTQLLNHVQEHGLALLAAGHVLAQHRRTSCATMLAQVR